MWQDFVTYVGKL
jgi:hypothetical protein